MIIKRYNKNPILTPSAERSWEAEAVFNGCPVKKMTQFFFFIVQCHCHITILLPMQN